MTRFAVTAALMVAGWLQQTPARDVPVQIVGTAVISGTVFTGPTGSDPARKARVMLASVDRRVPGQTVATDDDGRFEFHGVPGGRYTIDVQKPGYLRGSYGTTRPNRTGTPVAVPDGGRLDGLSIRLIHGASITGIVRDARGRPIPGVSVSALRYGYSFVWGEKQLSQAGSATTDDQGEYRVWGLAPGEFVVAVMPRDPGNSGAWPSNDFAMLTAADVDRVLQGVPQPATSSQAQVSVSNYAPVFFPGTSDAALARAIVIAAAEDRQGIDVVVSPVRTARIDGVVTTRDGQPAGPARITLAGAGEGANLLGRGGLWRPRAATLDKQGHFTFPDVPPGNYTLLALSTSPQGATATQPSPATWAMSDVTANGEAVNVSLTMQPAMTIGGRVVFNGQSPPPSDPTALIIRLVPPGSGGDIGTGPLGGDVSADRTFSFVGAVPGDYRMVLVMRTQTPWGWWPRSAMVGGVDALDGPLKIAPGENPEMVLTYTDRPTEISGQFQDATGRPAVDYFIVAFPADRAQWTPGSRRVMSARPDNDGHYLMRGLPPGDYLLAALTDLDPQDLYSTAIFDELAPLAAKVTLTEGLVTKRDLRVGRTPNKP